MNKNNIHFQVSNDVHLSGRVWLPLQEAGTKGVVLIVHGMAEHIDRYDGFADFLTNNNYIVYGYNQRGHKESIKTYDDYGYISDNDGFKDFLSDLHEVFSGVKEKHPDLPMFMFGHSMGSFIQQRFAQTCGVKYDGMILSGSGLQSNIMLNIGKCISNRSVRKKGRRYRSKFLNDLVFKANNKVFKPNRTLYDWLNRDEEEVDKYVNDPYCGGEFTNSFYLDFFNGLLSITKNFHTIPKSLPIYIISGSSDPVGNMGKSVIKLYNRFKKEQIENVSIKLYPEARHEILLETCKEEVWTDILKWLNSIAK